METTIKVTTMKCENCAKRITEALSKQNIKHILDFKTKSISLDDSDKDKALEIIKKLRY